MGRLLLQWLAFQRTAPRHFNRDLHGATLASLTLMQIALNAP